MASSSAHGRSQSHMIRRENSINIHVFPTIDVSQVGIQKKKGCKRVFLIKRLQVKRQKYDKFYKRNSFSQSPSPKSTSCSISHISFKDTSAVPNMFNFLAISFFPFEMASLRPLSVAWDHCKGCHQSNSPVMYEIYGSKVLDTF